MSLAHRVIPTLLCRGRQLVKGQRFNAWRSVGLVAQAVRIHQARGVDEIVLLDIEATEQKRGPNLELIDELAKTMFSPLTVGGGIRTADDVREVLAHGADKVAICTATFAPNALEAASRAVGSQAIVAAIDARWNGVWSHCGKQRWETHPASWAKQCQDDGAGEILLTSIEYEGKMAGYDLDLIRSVTTAVDIPVIAHGGAGTYQHMVQAIEAGASAVAAGSMFLFTDNTPQGAALYLQEHGIEARMPCV